MQQPPPLSSLRVLELAGLAPAPYLGLLLADYGAQTLRIDRPAPPNSPAPPAVDRLTRRKSSLVLDLKSPDGIALLRALAATADVLIDPYRPGVLESLGLDPTELCRANPRLIVARLTGFRRDGKYAAMAGHDINYLAVSGILSALGRRGETPYAPGNLLADFAGGGLVLFAGVLLALVERGRSGRGQVVEANMVDGVTHLGTFMRLAMGTDLWGRERGENVLDGGCPWYDTYETADGGFMAVGALEERFFGELVKGLGLDERWNAWRADRRRWDELRQVLKHRFKEKTRKEWEAVFDGTDACCTPVLAIQELRDRGHDQRPLAGLRNSPGLEIAVSAMASAREDGRSKGPGDEGWESDGLEAGHGGENLLKQWTGWDRGKQYDLRDGAFVALSSTPRAKL